MNATGLYSLAIEHLRSDNAIRNLVSRVYEQEPTAASVPYIYLSIHHSKGVPTFDELTSKVHVVCYTLSYSMLETLEIVEHTKRVLRKLLRETELTLNSNTHRTVRRGEIFQSTVSFEVLIDDYLEI